MSKQEEILEFIKSHIGKEGYPPTIREIAVGVGLASSSTVHGHLDRLEGKGLIIRQKTLTRAIRVLNHHEKESASSGDLSASTD